MIAAVCLLVRGEARADDKIALGITSATAFSLPHYIAEEKRLYVARHLEVETYVVGSAAGVLQQLAAGGLNIAQAATDQSLRAMLRKVPIRIIAGAASNAPFRMVAAKSIGSWGDLRGRTVSVGGQTDVTLYFLRVMARKNGLADGDYDLVYGGGSPNRLAQLASGAIAAAMLTNPQDFLALRQGVVDLGSVPQYLPRWAQNNLLVDTRWAATHADAIRTFLGATIEATRYLYDPAHHDDVAAILARHTKVAPDIAAETLDLFIEQKVVAPDAAVFPEGIRANLEALVALGELASVPGVDDFLDLSYLSAVKP